MFIVKKIVVTLCLLSALAAVSVGQAPQAQMNASMTGATQETKSLADDFCAETFDVPNAYGQAQIDQGLLSAQHSNF